MQMITRRNFLKTSALAGLTLGLSRVGSASDSSGANDAVHVAVIGLGGIQTPGGVGGRGRQLIASLRKTPGAKIVALCDVDQAVLDHELQPFKDRGETVTAYR